MSALAGLLINLLGLVQEILNLYTWVVIIAAILSFVQLDPRNPIVEILNRLTYPVFAWVRKKIPFVVISGIDLSPIAIIFGIRLIDIFITFLQSLISGVLA